MSSKQRSTPSRTRTKRTRARSLEQLAGPKQPLPLSDDDEDVPALELAGQREQERGGRDLNPGTYAIPDDASADLRQAMRAVEWAAGRGVMLTHVTVGGVTLGIGAMGTSRGLNTPVEGRAESRLYEEYGGDALRRALATDAGPEDDEE